MIEKRDPTMIVPHSWTKFTSLILVLMVLILVFIPQQTAQAFTQLDKLTASDAAADDQFGFSVAIDGTTVVSGARFDDDGVPGSGSVYVYDCSVYPCVEVSKLTASDAAANRYFGVNVAISGTLVVVGVERDGHAGSNSGAAYVFDLATCGAACHEVSKLIASDAAMGDSFGHSVAVSGTTAVIGTKWDDHSGISGAGAAYVFDLAACGATCTEVSKLTASDAGTNDCLGVTVAVDGTTALVGATYDDDGGTDSGAAYVFNLATCGAACHEVSKLTASDPEPDDQFSQGVALDGTTALVGVYRADDGGTDSGAAYVFDLTTCGAACHQTSKLTASDGSTNDYFGLSVSISGTTALVGAMNDDDRGSNSGAAYVFDLATCGATCTQVSKLIAADTAAGDTFGRSVDVDGTTAVVGAAFDDDGVNGAGSAYVFDTLSIAYDFGDAADPTYPTLLASNGAQHTLGTNVYLGVCVDGEADGQPNATAAGDDGMVGTPVYGTCSGNDDEDGVMFTSAIEPGTNATVDVTAHSACTLSAWVDFNADGDWADAGDDIFPGGVALAVGVNNLSFPVPAGATLGDTYARFRCTTDGAVPFTGTASDGEVEDYRVTIAFAAPEIDVQRPTGTSIPDGGTDALGNQLTGIRTLTYTIDNTSGTDQLDVTAVTESNLVNVSGFAVVTGLPLNIAAGATDTLQIQFTIDAVGAFSFDLDIANTDADEDPYDMTISGTGVITLPSASTGDDDDDNNNDDTSAAVNDGTVWEIIVQANPPFALPGNSVTFTITIRKLSGGTPITMAFPISDNFAIQSVTSNRGTTSYSGQDVTFTDEMHVGDEAVITVNTVLSPGLVPPYVLTEEACIVSPVTLCDPATVSSVLELPATGETPLWAQELQDSE